MINILDAKCIEIYFYFIEQLSYLILFLYVLFVALLFYHIYIYYEVECTKMM